MSVRSGELMFAHVTVIGPSPLWANEGWDCCGSVAIISPGLLLALTSPLLQSVSRTEPVCCCVVWKRLGEVVAEARVHGLARLQHELRRRLQLDGK